jgi:hypothetical protein
VADFERLYSEHEFGVLEWLRRCEGARPDFEEPERVLTHRMLQRGSAGFDGVLTYEPLAREAIEMFEPGVDATPEVRVVYPKRTFVSDHPVTYFSPSCEELARATLDSWQQAGDYSLASVLRLVADLAFSGKCASRDIGESAAARRFTEFLRSDPMQRRAIELGYRPGQPDFDIGNARVEHNPFLELREHGVVLELGADLTMRPGFELTVEFQQLWADATGRY